MEAFEVAGLCYVQLDYSGARQDLFLIDGEQPQMVIVDCYDVSQCLDGKIHASAGLD